MKNLIGISGYIGSGKDTIGSIIQYLTTRPDMSYSSFLLLSKEEQEYNWKIKKFAYKLKQIVSILTGISIEDLEKQEVKEKTLGEEWIRYTYAHGFTINSSYNPKCDNGNTSILTTECSKERYEEELRVSWQTAYKVEYTVRLLLQRIGTEAMRDIIHNNIWVNALFSDYKAYIKGYPQLIKSNNNPLIEGNKYSMGEAILPKWIITDVRFPNEAKAIKDRGGIIIRINRNLNCKNCNINVYSDEKKEIICSYGKCKNNKHSSETSLDDYDFNYRIDNNSTIEDLIMKVKEILIKEKYYDTRN